MNDLEDMEGDEFGDSEEMDATGEPYPTEVSESSVNVTDLAKDYDYDVDTTIFFWDELLPTLIVYSLTFILGLIGNILIIFTTLRYRKMKSTTNVFLASLASADLLLIVFCIPVKESTGKGRNYTKDLALDKLSRTLDRVVTGNCPRRGDEDEHRRGSDESELEDLTLKLRAALGELIRNGGGDPLSLPVDNQNPVLAYPISTLSDIASRHRTERRRRVVVFPVEEQQGLGDQAHPSNSDEDTSEVEATEADETEEIEEPEEHVLYTENEPVETSPNEKQKETDKSVEKGIRRLDTRLQGLLKKMKGSPTKEQGGIKKGLERLRETSEAVLKKLRAESFDCCPGGAGCGCQTGQRTGQSTGTKSQHGRKLFHTNGYRSEPDSAVQTEHTKSLVFKTSGSEMQLNVGMEITMENIDPATGQRLGPEVNKDFEQQGNIQCKLLKPGEDPVTFINTDFLYNPHTGMLFRDSKEKSGKIRGDESTTMYQLNQRSGSPMRKRSGVSESSCRDCLEENQVRVRRTSPARVVVSDPFRLAVEREEMRNARYLNGRRRSSGPTKMASHVQAIRLDGGQGVKFAETVSRRAYRVNGPRQVGRNARSASPVKHAAVVVSDKMVQANLDRRKKSPGEARKKSVEVQADSRTRPKFTIERTTESHYLGPVIVVAHKATQTLTMTRPGRHRTDAASQANLVLEDQEKYVRELETQKKVNLAIAELCYHLSNNGEESSDV